jgi:hypothetical protein
MRVDRLLVANGGRVRFLSRYLLDLDSFNRKHFSTLRISMAMRSVV